jgi:hypothetical protein
MSVYVCLCIMYVCVCVYFYVCMYVCMCFYVCTCVCMYIYIRYLSIYLSVRPSIIICHQGPWISLLFYIPRFSGFGHPCWKAFQCSCNCDHALFIYQLPWPRSQCVKALTRNLSQSGAYHKEKARASLPLQILITNVTAHGFLWLTQDWLSKGLIRLIDLSIYTTNEQLSHFDQHSDWQLRDLLIFWGAVSRRCQYLTA